MSSNNNNNNQGSDLDHIQNVFVLQRRGHAYIQNPLFVRQLVQRKKTPISSNLLHELPPNVSRSKCINKVTITSKSILDQRWSHFLPSQQCQGAHDYCLRVFDAFSGFGVRSFVACMEEKANNLVYETRQSLASERKRVRDSFINAVEDDPLIQEAYKRQEDLKSLDKMRRKGGSKRLPSQGLGSKKEKNDLLHLFQKEGRQWPRSKLVKFVQCLFESPATVHKSMRMMNFTIHGNSITFVSEIDVIVTRPGVCDMSSTEFLALLPLEEVCRLATKKQIVTKRESVSCTMACDPSANLQLVRGVYKADLQLETEDLEVTDVLKEEINDLIVQSAKCRMYTDRSFSMFAPEKVEFMGRFANLRDFDFWQNKCIECPICHRRVMLPSSQMFTCGHFVCGDCLDKWDACSLCKTAAQVRDIHTILKPVLFVPDDSQVVQIRFPQPQPNNHQTRANLGVANQSEQIGGDSPSSRASAGSMQSNASIASSNSGSQNQPVLEQPGGGSGDQSMEQSSNLTDQSFPDHDPVVQAQRLASSGQNSHGMPSNPPATQQSATGIQDHLSSANPLAESTSSIQDQNHVPQPVLSNQNEHRPVRDDMEEEKDDASSDPSDSSRGMTRLSSRFAGCSISESNKPKSGHPNPFSPELFQQSSAEHAPEGVSVRHSALFQRSLRDNASSVIRSDPEVGAPVVSSEPDQIPTGTQPPRSRAPQVGATQSQSGSEVSSLEYELASEGEEVIDTSTTKSRVRHLPDKSAASLGSTTLGGLPTSASVHEDSDRSICSDSFMFQEPRGDGSEKDKIV